MRGMFPFGMIICDKIAIANIGKYYKETKNKNTRQTALTFVFCCKFVRLSIVDFCEV